MMILPVFVFTLFGATQGSPHAVPIGRIAGGQAVDISSYPYALQISYLGLLECGGVLVTNKYVLTAAHCTYSKNMEDFEVRVGTTNYADGGQTFTVTGLATHPQFVWDSNYYDASILLLSDVVTLGTAQLATWATDDGSITAGTTVYIVGWGWLQLTDYDDYSPTLQQADLTILDDASCLALYYDQTVADAAFCANYTGTVKDFCFGDYGGPAVVNGVVQGLISFGEGCGDGYSIKAFVRMSKIAAWVQQIIDQ